MKGLKNILEECSIKNIYLENRGTPIFYKIPIYQRNYAWERDEIRALIKDVYDSLKLSKLVYYIGTLVTYKRDENVYEIIDGQQRLTTIYILLKALDVDNIANTLTYSARKISAETIKNMTRSETEKDIAILNGFDYAKDEINDIVGDKPNDIEEFKEYFLNNVHIIHYCVPKDVDLNHYFEVMNSRGEQLEKHEIVKAKLCDKLIGDDAAMEKFSRIWEACSDMNFYIQQKLPEMASVFDETKLSFKLSFDDLPQPNVGPSLLSEKKSISELLKVSIKKVGIEEEDDLNDRFQPIIDFPNFLLLVLKIMRLRSETNFNPSNFSLDDKELIKEFDKASLTSDSVKEFACTLLLAKYFLDNYVIHHTNGDDLASENPWKLQRYVKEKKSGYLKGLYEEDTKQNEMIQLLSMFEVAFTPKQRKNYLFYTLYHLFENPDPDSYIEFLRKLADKYFFDVYLDKSRLNERSQPKPNSFDEAILIDNKLNVERLDRSCDFESIYPVGSSNIPLYVFNYTDYKLWKKYAIELRGNKEKDNRMTFFKSLGCSDFGLDVFNNFYFSRTRKSLEHYYPQAKAGDGKPISTQAINCFGNFAMIGSDSNSSGSNWNTIDKKNRYLDTKSNPVSVASLKFRIMLQICQDNYNSGIKDENQKRESGLEWNLEDMKLHQKRMIDIIMGKDQ